MNRERLTIAGAHRNERKKNCFLENTLRNHSLPVVARLEGTTTQTIFLIMVGSKTEENAAAHGAAPLGAARIHRVSS